MPIRAPLDVDGSDPRPRHTSIGIGEYGAGQPHPPRRYGVTPTQRSRAGRPNGEPVSSASRSWSAMPESPPASRSANTSSSASKRRSTPFRDGLLVLGATRRGRGQVVRKLTCPRTRTRPSDWWVAPVTA